MILTKVKGGCVYLYSSDKKKATIRSQKYVSYDIMEEKLLFFQCNLTSANSSLPTMRWNKSVMFDSLPNVNVTNEFLIITIDSNCFSECAKLFGEYRCVAEKGNSRENRVTPLPG